MILLGGLEDNVPELAPKYKTLMRYKAMAIKLRQHKQNHRVRIIQSFVTVMSSSGTVTAPLLNVCHTPRHDPS